MKELLSIYGMVIEVVWEHEQFDKIKGDNWEVKDGELIWVFEDPKIAIDTYILHMFIFKIAKFCENERITNII